MYINQEEKNICYCEHNQKEHTYRSKALGGDVKLIEKLKERHVIDVNDGWDRYVIYGN